MRIAALWRSPVKSLQGESLPRATVDERGIVGDRRFALVDEETGFVLTARREPALLWATATYDEDADRAVVTLPEIGRTDDDGVLSRWLGRPVHLERAAPDRRSTYENLVDVEHEAESRWVTWQGPAGSFHDSTRTQLSLLGAATVAAWDLRRFRANVVLDAPAGDEDDLVGHRVGLGDATADVVKRIDRCVVVTRPQPGGIARDLDVLRAVNRDRDGCAGVGALVVEAGDVAVGDELRVIT